MWSELNTFLFTEDFVLLSEGMADRVFFEKLILAGKIPKCDFPWPVGPDDDNAPEEQKKLHGLTGFEHMLRMFNRIQALRPVDTRNVKGVLIVADARDKPEDTFDCIKKQIAAATKFGVPSELGKAVKSTAGHPAVGVILIPPDRPGSLETLCVKHLSDRYSDVAACMVSYMACDAVAKSTKDWNIETKEKAKLQSIVAVTNREDPNKTIRRLFSSTKETQARIKVADACFEEVWKVVNAFVDQVKAL